MDGVLNHFLVHQVQGVLETSQTLVFETFFEGNIFSQENTETLYYLFKLFFTLTMFA